jgi:hypothetical protein
MITRLLQFFHVFLFLAILMAISPAAAQKPSKKVLERSNVESLPPPHRGHGHAIGIMLHKGRAKPGLPIFPLLFSDTGGTISKTPAAKTDENGNWVILNLKPGKYSVRCKVSSGKFFVIEDEIHKVKAGKVTDFGIMDFKGDLK